MEATEVAKGILTRMSKHRDSQLSSVRDDPGWRVVATYESLVMHRQNRYTVLSNAGHQRGDVIERYTRGLGSSKTPEFFRDHNAIGLTPDTDYPPG